VTWAILSGMDHAAARAFVDRWIANWNKHDVDAVLADFAEDVVFSSPLLRGMAPDTDGVVRGKAALREYWTAAMRQLPDLRFDLVGVYLGVNTVVINFRNHQGRLVNEVLMLDGPLVVEGRATHLDG
jgi:ketosteroid isomerase-like protein